MCGGGGDIFLYTVAAGPGWYGGLGIPPVSLPSRTVCGTIGTIGSLESHRCNVCGYCLGNSGAYVWWLARYTTNSVAVFVDEGQQRGLLSAYS
jgi:hypothetical protein